MAEPANDEVIDAESLTEDINSMSAYGWMGHGRVEGRGNVEGHGGVEGQDCSKWTLSFHCRKGKEGCKHYYLHWTNTQPLKQINVIKVKLVCSLPKNLI